MVNVPLMKTSSHPWPAPPFQPRIVTRQPSTAAALPRAPAPRRKRPRLRVVPESIAPTGTVLQWAWEERRRTEFWELIAYLVLAVVGLAGMGLALL